jgi:hypothetical protein
MSDSGKIPESLYLAAIPIAGTAAAYLFEMGFCGYHDIPVSLITLSPSRIVLASVVGLIAAFCIHFYVALILAFYGRRKSLVFRFLALGMSYAFLPFVLLVAVGGNSWAYWLMVLTFSIPFAIGLIPAFRARETGEGFFQRWWKESAFELTPEAHKSDHLEGDIERPQRWIAVALLSTFLFYGLGMRYAKIVTPDQMLLSDPSLALIVVYGDRWIFRPVDSLTSDPAFGRPQLTILSGSKTEDLRLQNRKSINKAIPEPQEPNHDQPPTQSAPSS